MAKTKVKGQVSGERLNYILSQPAIFCFLISLLLITITLAALGVYVRGREHMPDLDAMKNWNAYIGKLSSQDHCFKLSAPREDGSFQEIFQRYNSGTTFQGRNGSCAQIDQLEMTEGGRMPQYGTADISFDFFVNRELVKAEDMYSGVLYSEFTGTDVGTQIRDYRSKERIDANISIIIWIPVQAQDKKDQSDKLKGCLIITAPLSSVPTRMPLFHGNFTFASKILKSGSRRPPVCSCDMFSNESYTVYKHDMVQCNIEHTFKVRKSPSKNKAYGVLEIELSKDDRMKASQHMFLASLTLILFALAITIVILFKKRTPNS